MAMIITLQLAARKNLIQMSSDVTIVTVIPDFQGTYQQLAFHRKYDWSSSRFFYNRQVTHNSRLYENQDFNVLKITNLTFRTDI
jgi:hypothetical protein